MKPILSSILLSLFILAGCASEPGASSSVLVSDPVQVDPNFPPALVELEFDSYGDRLNGILYQANGVGPHPTAVLLHGYPGNEKNLDLAQSLRRVGYNVLFFHYRGAWGSEGEFSFTHVAEDVGSALDFLRDKAEHYRVDDKRLVLIGHSMGGFAALHGAARDNSIDCVVAIAPADLGLVADFTKASREAAESFSSGADALGMLHGWSGEQALAELKNKRDALSLAGIAPRLNGKSVLLIAGDKDSVLAPETFHVPLVASYKQQPNINLTHSVLPGDHAFSWSRIILTTKVINWVKECE